MENVDAIRATEDWNSMATDNGPIGRGRVAGGAASHPSRAWEQSLHPGDDGSLALSRRSFRKGYMVQASPDRLPGERADVGIRGQSAVGRQQISLPGRR